MLHPNKFLKLNINAGAKRTQIAHPKGNKIIYLSSGGCESNDGITPSTPRYDIARVPEYLKNGYSVLLQAGSKWYNPDFLWELYDINAGEDNPLVVGSYGEGEPPIVAALRLVEPNEWVSEGCGLMSVLSADDTLRLYINNKMLLEVQTEQELNEGTFIQKDGKLYIKSNKAPELAEILSSSQMDKFAVIEFKNIGYLTIQNIVIKGGRKTTIRGIAPSSHFVLDHVELRSMLLYATWITSDKDDMTAYHDTFTITDSIIDRTWNSRALSCYREDAYSGVYARCADGIFLTDAHIGAYIAGNIVRDFGHTAINLEILENRFKGIHNCVIERNVVSGTNSEYLRACETIGPDGLCTNNTVRYNYFYDLTNSSHLLGEYNKYYCNVFVYIVPTVLKTVQPFAIDSESWPYNGFEFVARGNIIANNTIYNCTGSLAFADNVYNCTIANNLLVGWSYSGSIKLGETKEELTFINNCFFSTENDNVLWNNWGKVAKIKDLNKNKLSSGNIFANPIFNEAQINDFTLAENSPCAEAGRPLCDFINEQYLDMNGNPFDLEHPSIGAFSALKIHK